MCEPRRGGVPALHIYAEDTIDQLDDAFESAEQDLKDVIHQRLLERSEADPVTGCQVYTGSWDSVNGQAKMRVGAKVYTVTRIAAWCYGDCLDEEGKVVSDFSLYDTRQVRRTCNTPACFSREHLVVCQDKASVTRARCAARTFAWNGGRRLNQEMADEIRRDAERLEIEALYRKYCELPKHVILKVINNETWVRRRAS